MNQYYQGGDPGFCSNCHTKIYRRRMFRLPKAGLNLQATYTQDEPDISTVNIQPEEFYLFYDEQHREITTCPTCWTRLGDNGMNQYMSVQEWAARVIAREIWELEREANDPLVRPGTRQICARKARLLRAGYRAQEVPGDLRVINIINLKSGEIVLQVSMKSLEYARFDILLEVRMAEEQKRAALEKGKI